jgi:tetratricopeptide (TPR) repeat protein
LARRDLSAARVEAAAYMQGATDRHNDARVREAHQLDGLIALADHKYEECLSALAQADQSDPAVWYAMARAYDGLGDHTKAKALTDRAIHLNDLPSFSYAFTRAAAGGATRSATSGSAHERRR